MISDESSAASPAAVAKWKKWRQILRFKLKSKKKYSINDCSNRIICSFIEWRFGCEISYHKEMLTAHVWCTRHHKNRIKSVIHTESWRLFFRTFLSIFFSMLVFNTSGFSWSAQLMLTFRLWVSSEQWTRMRTTKSIPDKRIAGSLFTPLDTLNDLEGQTKRKFHDGYSFAPSNRFSQSMIDFLFDSLFFFLLSAASLTFDSTWWSINTLIDTSIYR